MELSSGTPTPSAPEESTTPESPRPRRTADERSALLDAAFRAHFDSLWRLAGRLGCPVSEREDLVAEVMYVFARRVEDFDTTRGTQGAWLAGILANAWRNYARRLTSWRRRMLPLEEPDTITPTDDSPSPDDALVKREEARGLLSLLDALSPPLREAWVLQELEEMTQAQIAAHLDIPLGTVARRVQRASQKLRELAEAQRRDRAVIPLPLFVGSSGSDLLGRLVDEERHRAPDVPAGTLERVLERARDAVLPREPGLPASEGAARGWWKRATGVRGWLPRAALFGVGALAGVLAHRAFMREPPARMVVRTETRTLLVREPAVTTEAARPAERSTVEVPTVTVRAERPPTRPVAPRGLTLSQAEAEQLLIDRASAAWMRGDIAGTRAALDEHDRRFHDGYMREERQTLRARALARGETR